MRKKNDVIIQQQSLLYDFLLHRSLMQESLAYVIEDDDPSVKGIRAGSSRSRSAQHHPARRSFFFLFRQSFIKKGRDSLVLVISIFYCCCSLPVGPNSRKQMYKEKKEMGAEG